MGGRLKEKRQEKLYQEDSNRKKAGRYINSRQKRLIDKNDHKLLI